MICWRTLSVIFLAIPTIAFWGCIPNIHYRCRPMLALYENIEKNEIDRRNIWSTVTQLENRALYLLSKADITDLEIDESIDLFARSVGHKLTDPFVSLCSQYHLAIKNGDIDEKTRIFKILKEIGLPAHVQNAVKVPKLEKNQESTKLSKSVSHTSCSEVLSENVRIKVNTFYDSQASQPFDGKYIFTCKIAVANEGPESIQLVGSRWEIEHFDGEIEILQNVGIGGQQPIVQSGTVFTYSSMCPFRVFPSTDERIIGKMTVSYTISKGNFGDTILSLNGTTVHFVVPDNIPLLEAAT